MLSNIEEVWKDVLGYEGLYQVSNRGGVRGLNRHIDNGKGGLQFVRGRILKVHIGSDGYYDVNLSKMGNVSNRDVHQLVAITFLNHTPCKFEIVVDHINGNKLDNYVENLRLITNRENVSKGMRGGTSQFPGVNWCKHLSKWQSRIKINGKREFLGYFKEELAAHEAYQNRLEEHLASRIN